MLKYNETLYELCGLDLDHQKIIELIKNEDIWLKQIGFLKLQIIKSQEEADLLIENLTGIDGKVRDVVSLKISELIDLHPVFFQKENYIKVFVEAICDVNPNVARNIINCINYIDNQKYLFDLSINKINLILNDIDLMNKKYGHIYNKLTFHLYWLLEALDKIKDNELCDELKERFSNWPQYPIREKIAQLIKKTKDKKFEEKLRNDANFYVRRIFCDNIF